MNAQELLVHDSSQGQTAERLHASLVNGFRVLVFAFQLEGEVVCQVTALVVSAEQPEGFGVVNLEGPEIEHTLNTEVTTVNIIAKEEISRLGRIPTDFEELHKIVVLAVNVSTDGNRGVHLEEIWLGTEQLGTLSENP